MNARHIAVGDQSIAVYDTGSEGVPLLLITGFIGAASFWDPFIAALPTNQRALSYDQRGSEASGAYDKPLDMEQLADDALAVIRQLNLPAVHVVGHSMGACAAWIMAAKEPAAIRSAYVLAGWSHADTWMRRVFDARLTAYEFAGSLKYVEATTLAMNPPSVVNLNADPTREAEAILAQKLPPLNELKERTDAILSFNAAQWEPDATVPMRIACATDDLMTPITLSEELHAMQPNSSLKRFAAGGHYLPRSFQKELADDVMSWVSSVDVI